MRQKKSPILTGSDGIDYVKFGIGHKMTGHLDAYGDECGTCDGGKCDFCEEVWDVVTMGESERVPWPHPIVRERFWDKDEAIERFNELVSEYNAQT